MSGIIHRNRPLTPRELNAAINTDPKQYPQDMPCMMCGYRWMQHMGTLCPASPGGILILDGEPMMVKPVFQKTDTFLPDVSYYNQNPDFDVV